MATDGGKEEMLKQIQNDREEPLEGWSHDVVLGKSQIWQHRLDMTKEARRGLADPIWLAFRIENHQ